MQTRKRRLACVGAGCWSRAAIALQMATTRSKLGGVYSAELIQKLDKKHHAILKAMRAEPGNRECAECQASPTTWASVTLGVFVCMKCSQVHRNLGAHLSKVKSCMGTYLWCPDEIERMRQLGNARVGRLYTGGARSPPQKPTAGAPFEEIDRYARDKYERRRWMMPGGMEAVLAEERLRPPPHAGAAAAAAAVRVAATAAAAPTRGGRNTAARATARNRVRQMRQHSQEGEGQGQGQGPSPGSGGGGGEWAAMVEKQRRLAPPLELGAQTAVPLVPPPPPQVGPPQPAPMLAAAVPVLAPPPTPAAGGGGGGGGAGALSRTSSYEAASLAREAAAASVEAQSWAALVDRQRQQAPPLQLGAQTAVPQQQEYPAATLPLRAAAVPVEPPQQRGASGGGAGLSRTSSYELASLEQAAASVSAVASAFAPALAPTPALALAPASSAGVVDLLGGSGSWGRCQQPAETVVGQGCPECFVGVLRSDGACANPVCRRSMPGAGLGQAAAAGHLGSSTAPTPDPRAQLSWAAGGFGVHSQPLPAADWGVFN
jgi:hypothetical protein